MQNMLTWLVEDSYRFQLEHEIYMDNRIYYPFLFHKGDIKLIMQQGLFTLKVFVPLHGAQHIFP